MEAPKIQVRYGIPLDVLEPQYWSRAENMVGRCDMKYPASLNKETNEAFVKTAFEFFIACLSAQAHCVFCSYWVDLTFYDILSHETIHLLTTREMTVSGRDREEEDRERWRSN